MLSLFLAAVVCQFGEPEILVTEVLSTSVTPLHDLAFERATEEFVARAIPRNHAPEPYRSLLTAMGDVKWKARDEATKTLEAVCKTNVSARRWLWWGRMSTDPEIRHRSNAIIRRINLCTVCKGSGSSKNWTEYPCSDCDGDGTIWPMSAWDDRIRMPKAEQDRW